MTGCLVMVLGAVVLSFIVLVHELGHWLAARLSRVAAPAFSIGFGRVLIRKRLGITEFRVSLLPMGGYVQLANDGRDLDGLFAQLPESEAAQARERWVSFESVRPWKKFAIAAAGPFASLLLGFALLWGLRFVSGINVPVERPTIVRVLDGSAAEAAGLKPGDQFTMVNGEPIRMTRQVIIETILAGAKPIVVEVERDGKLVRFTLTPEARTTGPRPLPQMGVELKQDCHHRSLGVSESFVGAGSETWLQAKNQFRTLAALVTGRISLRNLNGPVGLMHASGQAFSGGLVLALTVAAVVSISLAVINSVPVAPLDGSLMLLAVLEQVTGRKPSGALVIVYQIAGVALMVTMMIVGTVFDIHALL